MNTASRRLPNLESLAQVGANDLRIIVSVIERVSGLTDHSL